MFKTQVKVNIQHTPKSSQFLNLIDQLAAIHKLTAGFSASAAIDAQPDGRRPHQFVDHPKIDHTKQNPGIKYRSFTNDWAGTAAFSTGKTGQ